jgi:hypothetical protein
MTIDEFYEETIEAKEEYDDRVKPILKKLERVKDMAWKIYLKRIIQINEKGDHCEN